MALQREGVLPPPFVWAPGDLSGVLRTLPWYPAQAQLAVATTVHRAVHTPGGVCCLCAVAAAAVLQ